MGKSRFYCNIEGEGLNEVEKARHNPALVECWLRKSVKKKEEKTSGKKFSPFLKVWDEVAAPFQHFLKVLTQLTLIFQTSFTSARLPVFIENDIPFKIIHHSFFLWQVGDFWSKNFTTNMTLILRWSPTTALAIWKFGLHLNLHFKLLNSEK